jgi:hypothetical protein
MASLWERSDAAYSPLIQQAKWRACKGYATNLAYITGTDTTYKAEWAVNASQSALLDKTKSSYSDLVAACTALVGEGQVGEIYVIAKDPYCTDGCMRMAIYPETEVGLVIGRVTDAGSQQKWVCGKSAPPPVQPPCPGDGLYSPVTQQAKWRACKGYATNLAYITGTDTTYKAGWAVNPSQSALLDKTKQSPSDLAAACNALVGDGQIGEIYVINNDPKCTDGCMRMAIYPETEEGLLVGRVTDAGTQHKYVCGKAAPPPVQPPCPTTCGEVKNAYKTSACCGNPEATYTSR